MTQKFKIGDKVMVKAMPDRTDSGRTGRVSGYDAGRYTVAYKYPMPLGALKLVDWIYAENELELFSEKTSMTIECPECGWSTHHGHKTGCSHRDPKQGWGPTCSGFYCGCPGCESQARKSTEQGGVKFDTDKPRMDLIDSYAMEELAKVLTFGAKKYAEHNWRKGITLSRLLAALLRHTFAMLRGEDIDEETGLAHGAHAMCCAMFIVWTTKHHPKMDDRYKRTFTTDEIKEKIYGTKR